MKTLTINGKDVRTNIIECGENRDYPFLKETPSMIPADIKIIPFGMSEHEYLKIKADEGYKRVTFYRTTTAIRGCYDVIARVY